MSDVLIVFSYPFAIRALTVGLLISLCAALLGVSLVLKRFSMLGDGLSHVAFGAAAIALAIGAAPLKIAIPVVVIAAFLLLRVGSRVRGDAAIAMVSSSALAVGIIVATFTTGMNTDINNYMFGSVLAVSREDMWVAIPVSAAVLGMYLLFFNKMFSCTFDESFSMAAGVRVKLYNSLLAVMTAVTVVIGMRIMGALLISSIITFPALSSMRICKSCRAVVACAGVVSCVCFLIGIVLSFVYDMPAGASVVVANLGIFLFFSIISTLRSHHCKAL